MPRTSTTVSSRTGSQYSNMNSYDWNFCAVADDDDEPPTSRTEALEDCAIVPQPVCHFVAPSILQSRDADADAHALATNRVASSRVESNRIEWNPQPLSLVCPTCTFHSLKSDQCQVNNETMPIRLLAEKNINFWPISLLRKRGYRSTDNNVACENSFSGI